MTTSFLPNGNDLLKTEKKYCRLSQFKEGENKLRVVMRPIAGWIDWQENKPKRYRPDAKPKHSYDPEKPIKPFWDIYIWDYDRKDLFILEITQMSVIKSLTSIVTDEDWGDMTQFDIKVKKEGSGKDTRYAVQPVPHKPISDDIKKALEIAPVRLEALYEGKDPWDEADTTPEAPNASDRSLGGLAALLNEEIKLPEPHMVLPYLEFCEPKVPKPMAEVVEVWIAKPEDCIKAYMKWLGSDTARQIREKASA